MNTQLILTLLVTYLFHIDSKGFQKGRIPEKGRSMLNLNDIVLDYNKFTGTIPENIGCMTNLNELTETIPDEMRTFHDLKRVLKLRNFWRKRPNDELCESRSESNDKLSDELKNP